MLLGEPLEHGAQKEVGNHPEERVLRFEWPELGVVVLADMEFGQNPSICEKVWAHLPMISMMGHVVISGESIWCPTRILHLGPDNMQTRQVGDVYFFGPGQSIVMTYGSVTESAKVNRFAQVRNECTADLQRVGKYVLESTVVNAKRKAVIVHLTGIEEQLLVSEE